jgi:hypothetical protein
VNIPPVRFASSPFHLIACYSDWIYEENELVINPGNSAIDFVSSAFSNSIILPLIDPD